MKGLMSMALSALRGRLRKTRLFWLGYFWMQYWFVGEFELTQLKHYVPRGKTSLDVGGNIGSYAYHLSRLSKQVVTFEPNPYFIERIGMLAIPNLQIEPVGVSDREGEADLRIPALLNREVQGMASLSRTAVSDAVMARLIQVPLRRIDQFRRDDIGFIKIDVEGHEESVLRGALDTIAACRPTILVEVEDRHNPGGLARIRALLEGLGYAGCFFFRGARRDIAEFEPDSHQCAPKNLDKGFSTRRGMPYVNNFLFTPGPVQFACEGGASTSSCASAGGGDQSRPVGV